VAQAFFDVAPMMKEFSGDKDVAEDAETAAKVSRFSFIPSAKAMFVTTGAGPSPNTLHPAIRSPACPSTQPASQEHAPTPHLLAILFPLSPFLSFSLSPFLSCSLSRSMSRAALDFAPLVCIVPVSEKFDAGVEGLIGRADPNTRRAIRAEHCLSDDSHDEFSTSNTGLTTTSWREYWIVVQEEDEQVPEGKLPEVDAADHRSIKSIGELMKEEMVSEAMLCFEEVLALRLYSGPMFMKYNTILREFPVDLLKQFKGNRYTTTIHLILSAILKLSRVQPIPKERLVYRGLGGRRLPKEFYVRDKTLSKGGVEAAFMSTTTDQATAVRYSNFGDKGLGIIFEIELGKMSTGADISIFSQYPKENEILFTPLTHLEIVGQPQTASVPPLLSARRPLFLISSPTALCPAASLSYNM
jgi:hypothetical protein